ncbi:hypothetical protein A2715_04405 [Candidatus Woesebacteria bacterium RIFCSPHIGHO2_01_FULL_39_32]|uniref:DUF4352 domain-containing protein n=2 Tax=Candidatus Woeseibacteriota TaxID=1752722 RepID=A0A0G0S6V3_9BACT|nr:MAG: hypothetical protein UT61_C0006G0031 [Candidatus Woesebacteria bacterium GW2011_GWA1_39_8]OGM25260.1 MAG: hypothetical protein A2715_04405 [Candidatus Woesebacteria bacterium RIFCSPHIGHO2_01_FULL_39_32]OGM37760.1 MAG: hypothetical protein A3F01_01615 [Candidatus Woesebacteria bacterium RIFCSPHIGHO2_12_FULL_38_11]OGM64791.1 MAG: hypothetical protein A2893_04015 [Candidatus Woesebacteria bacterium RIFCSPLOWO2_01_FULL_39_25]
MVFKNISLQLPLPIPSFFPKLAHSFERLNNSIRSSTPVLKGYIFTVFASLREMREKRRASVESNVQGFQEGKPKLRVRKYIKPLFIIGILAIAFILGVRALSRRGNVAGDQIEIGIAEKTLDVNKEFAFPLKDSEGEKVAEIKYIVEKAELRDEIIVKGKRATAIKGRTFLIFNLKVSNEFTQSININSKDYIRLSVNGNEEVWLAPDIHNDPVEVQAISTKYTRVGFPINDTDTNYVIRVGEIKGEKEKIPLSF